MEAIKNPKQINLMDSASDLIIDSLKKEPIGETDHFIWFITDIGIAALFKKEQNYEVYSSNVNIEANKIGLDITKEEKEYIKIKDKQLFLFYS
tara:strand:- start:163 stop:441 length:279 start_codon:yes stop_codon:yes gene_type:complete